MSRLKRFTHSLASGYVALIANTLFSLASVPLAFAYLTKQEFGLWALAAQAAGYMSLIDLGMSGVSRILIDYKDQKNGEDYGSVIQTLIWVSAAQGALILAASAVMAFGLPGPLRIPPELEHSFRWLVLGQGTLLAGGFLSRVLNYLLTAHQRYDVANYAQIISFAANYGVLWAGFARGDGVFSLLWGQIAGWILTVMICLVWCLRLRLFPAAGHWGKASWQRFQELFRLGRDIFIFFLGSQLVNASQTILLTRVLGLEAAAVWSVCTRVFVLATQVVNRPFVYSCAALAEMMVRQEWERLQRRFKSIVILSTSLSVVAAVLVAVANHSFVQVWSGGRISWPAINDVLLGIWLIVYVNAHSHIGLVGQTKEFGLMRYLYLVEGLVFVCGSLLVLRHGEAAAMLTVSILAGVSVTFPYALWRTSHLFKLSMQEVGWGWFRPSLRLLVALTPISAAVWAATRPLSEILRFGISTAVLTPLGLALLFRLGVEESFRSELLARCPDWLKPGVQWICGKQHRRAAKSSDPIL